MTKNQYPHTKNQCQWWLNIYIFFGSSSTDNPFFFLSSASNFFLFSTFDGSCLECMSVIFFICIWVWIVLRLYVEFGY